MRRGISGLGVLLLIVGSVLSYQSTASAGTKVAICHRTGGGMMRMIVISASVNALRKHLFNHLDTFPNPDGTCPL